MKNSLAALLALSATEPPPLFPLLPLLLLLILPLDPFFEVPPDFSRYFLASLTILSMRPNHAPFLTHFATVVLAQSRHLLTCQH